MLPLLLACVESVMQRFTIHTLCLKAQRHPNRLWLTLGLLVLAGSAFPAGQPATSVGGPAGKSKVPAWDARGLGPLPWQGIACVDMNADGRFVAVGTIAPPGDPNVFLLGEGGKVLEQHTVG